jgi:hypothetical protein
MRSSPTHTCLKKRVSNSKQCLVKKRNLSYRTDTTACLLRCGGCEKNKSKGSHSKTFKNIQSVWKHTWQCQNFIDGIHPTKNTQIKILGKISLVLKSGQSIKDISEACALGMIVN